MITEKEIWDQEMIYLQKVVREIKTQIDTGSNAVNNFKKEAIDLQKQMWEDVKLTPTDLFDLEGVTQVWQYQTDIASQARKYKFSYDKLSRLEKMYQSPYFGRIDFIEDGEEAAEQIYIGIHNLITGNNREILVYDWRAPISSMFYDYETGKCSYDCPAGLINGQMQLKRQYKIEKNNIVYMFDSSLSINDEMLREILGKSTDNKMKTIVTSIQREQNSVIRDSNSRILIVEGPAGSGKTSIALHRAAYLLYKYRESIKSENILVFSPNHVFEDYISNVLPELGEENIMRGTFADFFKSMLDSGYRIESMNQQMEYILSGNPNKVRLRCIKFKSSLQFLNIMKKYVCYLKEGAGMEFKDVIYNDELVISSAQISGLFKNDYSMFPYAKRLEKLRQRLFYLLEQCEEKRVMELLKNNSAGIQQSAEGEKLFKSQNANTEFESLKNEIIQFTSFNVYELYRNLLENMEAFAQPSDKHEIEDYSEFGIYTISQLNKGIINYEDIAPVIFLKTALDTVSIAKSIKHVIIDEAQDYTVIQYEIFRKVFEHCNMTILGDENQSINGYMNIGSFAAISEIFDKRDCKGIVLTKSYRSSKEISDFCKQILVAPDHAEQLNRHGSKPKITKTEKGNIYRRIADDIIMLKSRNHKLIAVICKNAGQCEALYKAVNPYVDISLVSNKNEEYQSGVVVIPSYLAKGLEFDAVLVSSIEEADYLEEEDRRLLYTVCTRALHELYLYYSENISGLIKNIGEHCYTE
ncbi:MAG: helD [Eubacterium sp.]|nr:helD [Eubacterium sp.]